MGTWFDNFSRRKASVSLHVLDVKLKKRYENIIEKLKEERLINQIELVKKIQVFPIAVHLKTRLSKKQLMQNKGLIMKDNYKRKEQRNKERNKKWKNGT